VRACQTLLLLHGGASPGGDSEEADGEDRGANCSLVGGVAGDYGANEEDQGREEGEEGRFS